MVKVSSGGFNNWVKTVRENLRRVPNVSETYCVLGDCDIIVKVETESSDQLSKIIVDEIKYIEGVEDAEVLVVAEE
ncbi:hypothetical protein AKJ45_01195 [candidate division MSBL1 archaeon SCGC-AAA261F19]|uniref:Transcription regulator AsnC/Lrp ligand binding domain-containing protein n=1 Tax=candidate division MSBL1 archaeon SCGC-AAA261F19 TaxID=1698275 RepID=A0A133VAU8_9EURY|nr:hypothetical protein AKJ45_01195 [candidate division MSBL1 archaeon SCGC-AAA261F19]